MCARSELIPHDHMDDSHILSCSVAVNASSHTSHTDCQNNVSSIAIEPHVQDADTNSLLRQICHLASHLRAHVCKRQRIHAHDPNSSECVIPSASLDDATTRCAWKRGSAPEYTHMHANGDGAYWATTLGPRTDRSSVRKGQPGKLRSLKRTIHLSSSIIPRGPTSGRPPDRAW